ncbi:hypothetical protein GOODEAATRI_001551 [Goodea atripinnis]|uniref:Uncharacterized protein n=1 Tax=Goodea atripinnis TaxID=208336 RepID=A0ABV0MNF4_9TELE
MRCAIFISSCCRPKTGNKGRSRGQAKIAYCIHSAPKIPPVAPHRSPSDGGGRLLRCVRALRLSTARSTRGHCTTLPRASKTLPNFDLDICVFPRFKSRRSHSSCRDVSLLSHGIKCGIVSHAYGQPSSRDDIRGTVVHACRCGVKIQIRTQFSSS